MMNDYEACHVHHPCSDLSGVFTWQACVAVPEGTALEDLMRLTEDLEEDRAVLHTSIRFPHSKESIGSSEELAAVITRRDEGALLSESIWVDTICGWPVS